MDGQFYAPSGWPEQSEAKLRPISRFLKRKASVVLLGDWYQDERRRFTRGPTVQDRHLQPSGITIFFIRMDLRIATARLK